MKKLALLAIAILTMGATGTYCDFVHYPPCTPSQEVAFIGDSITVGYSATPTSTFVYRTAMLYDPGDVTSSAISVTWSTEWGGVGQVGYPDYWLYDASGYADTHSRITVIMLGTNDAATSVQTDPNVYKANMQRIVDRALDENTCRVVLMTPPHQWHWGEPEDTEINARMDVLDDKLHEICDKNPNDRIECGPDLRDVLVPGDFTDGLHPSDYGHLKIFNVLKPQVEPRS